MPTPELKGDQMPVACMAPPLTDAKLAAYDKLIKDCDDARVADAMAMLMKCVKAWWVLPESKRESRGLVLMHRDDPAKERKPITVPVTPLEETHVASLDAVTPWMAELDHLSKGDVGLFDKLPLGELRNAAFHLLWHVKEITLDREPMTMDKLPK